MSRKDKGQQSVNGNDNAGNKSDHAEEKKSKSVLESGLESMTLITQLGLIIAIPIVLGAMGGHWLDGKFGTGMIFSLILLCLGIAGGIGGAYHQVTNVVKWKK